MVKPGFFRRNGVKKTDKAWRGAYPAALVIIGLFIMAASPGRAMADGPQGGEASQPGIRKPKDAAGRGSEVVARVNGVEISQAAVQAMAARMARGGGAPASSKEALDGLILAELAYQKAKAAGLAIDPPDIDNAVNEIKDNAGGEEIFRQMLAARKLSEEDLRRELERDFMIRRIIQKEVVAGIVISREELNREIEKARGELIKPGEKANMRQIRRSVEKKLKTREEKKRMAEWETELRKGAKIELMEEGDEKK